MRWALGKHQTQADKGVDAFVTETFTFRPCAWRLNRVNVSMSHKSVRRQKLESWLQDVDVFDKPKIFLEQYPTTPHIAACMLHTVHMNYNDLEGKCVADLGVGCGVLSLGCSMLGCSYVVGVDIDADALAVCTNNISDFDIHNIDLLQCDVTRLANHPCRLHGAFDVVVMNPPFGTKKNEGIDMLFLQAALKLSTSSVYSLHKTSTRPHILRRAENWGVEAEVLAELRYDLAKTMWCHKEGSVDIEVDFYRFSHRT